jgi:hypothetical protein
MIENGFAPNGAVNNLDYVRTPPAQFSGENDDLLMKSLITNYATEKRGGDGKPTGEFFMTKFSTGLALDEVV